MTWQLQTWLGFPSDLAAKAFLELLSAESRPDFIEDVNECDLEVFKKIQYWDFPHELKCDGACVWVWWHNTELSVEDIRSLTSLDEINVVLIYELTEHLVSDDDEENESGRFFELDSNEELHELFINDTKKKFSFILDGEVLQWKTL